MDYDPLKRLIDLVGAAVGLVLLSPVMAVAGTLIRWKMGPPVLFRQVRPGRDGELFTLTKFRTMLQGDAPDAERLTPLGQTLRKTSVDELPQLFNVLRGEMSLVGPRPLLPAYMQRYTPEQTRRHDVRPGITGLAQVTGRNNTTWEDRLRADVEYVQRRSLRLDVWILLRTLAVIIRPDNINHPEATTMPEFIG